MKNGHTPGPWQNCRRSNSDESFEVWADDSLIADVYETKRVGFLGTAQANARLIAAAPDLLEAIQHLVEVHQERPTYPPLEERITSWEKARVAIAKAVGR